MKAILVLDEMPEACRQCKFCEIAKDPCYDIRVCKVTGSLMSARAIGSKPNWCPLKEAPKKLCKHDGGANYPKEIEDAVANYQNGYNDCLDAILGTED